MTNGGIQEMVDREKEISLLREANEKYREYYDKYKGIITELMEYLASKHLQIIVWGAGLKGKAFLDYYDHHNRIVDYVIDMDMEKQGKALLTGHKIVGVNYIKHEDAVILVVNENYYPSICFSLINKGFDIKELKIICIDHYVNGKYNIQDIKNNTIWERKRYYD